ncbi:transcription repressor OFP17-like [Aristolochia californica]|uniref:transcription repressor OFP17-like n=1 Tax=Aristolochia californica TaxID=171875 RepID=UPI0035E0BBD2
MQTSVALQAKLYNPCKKFSQVVKFKLRRNIFKPLFRFRKLRRTAAGKTPRKRRTRGFFSIFQRRVQFEEMDQVREIKSLPELGQGREQHILFPSPITPAYLKKRETEGRSYVAERSNVEDACRSFENYLSEMIIEGKQVKDLTDVEELLYCWRNLRCPVFHDLVSRFYGELCMDLFSGEKEEMVDTPTNLISRLA